MPQTSHKQTARNQADDATTADDVPLMRQAVEHMQAGRLDAAEHAIHALLNEQPRLPQAYLVLGDLLARGQRLEDAVTAYEQALALNPRLAPAPLRIGRVRRAEGRPDAAAACYARAVEMDPNLPAAQLAIARLHMDDDAVDDAERALHRVLELQPASVAARLLLADIYLDDGRLRKAMRLLSDVVRERPKLIIAHLRLAQLHAARGTSRKAIDILNTATAQADDAALAWLLLGQVHLDGRDADAAETAFARALDHAPRLRMAAYGLADALIARGRYAAAIDRLRKLEIDNPLNNAVYQRYGLIHARLGQHRNALDSFRAALRFNPSLMTDDPELADMLAGNGDPAALSLAVAQRVAETQRACFIPPPRGVRAKRRERLAKLRRMSPRPSTSTATSTNRAHTPSSAVPAT